MRRIVGILLFASMVFVLSGGTVKAEEKPKITIAPFMQAVRINANEPVKSFNVTLINGTKQTQSFHLSVLNFGSLDETGGIVFAGNNANTLIKKYGLASWLRLSTNDLTLGAGQSADIEAAIINDSTLSPGGHYGAIVASVNSDNGLGSNQVNLKQQLSSLVLATKVGGEKYDLSLRGVGYDSNWGQVPSSVNLRFKNDGNVQIVPRGIVKLVAPNGHTIKQGTINEASSYVLPETYRKIPVELNDVGHGGWWPRFYKLVVYYRYDGINSFAVKTYPLYLVNWPLAMIEVVVFVALLLGIYKTLKYVHWRQTRPKPVPLVSYKKPAQKKPRKKTARSPKKTPK